MTGRTDGQTNYEEWTDLASDQIDFEFCYFTTLFVITVKIIFTFDAQ